MRKSLFLGSVLLFASLISACQKDKMPVPEGQTRMIGRTMLVEDGEWGLPEGRSAFVDGAVKLSGNENVGVFYNNAAETAAYNADKAENKKIAAYYWGVSNKNAVCASSAADWTYNFSHTALEGQESYDYYFILPYSYSGIRLNKGLVYARLSRVQFPQADSFDPGNDFLIGKPVRNISHNTAQSIRVEGFKRAFSPLRIDVTGLAEGETIRAVTLSFSQDRDVLIADRQWSRFINGNFNLNMSEDFKAAAVTGGQSRDGLSNAVTALYPTGLSAKGGVHPVWYMVNPTTLDADTEMSLTVSTDNRTITRTVILSEAMQLMKDRINHFSFNITGEGHVAAPSLTTDLTLDTVNDKNLPAGNGVSYLWDWDGTIGCWTKDTDNGKNNGTLPNALSIKAGTVTIPSFDGRRIREIRLYTHPGTGTDSGADVAVTVSYTKTDNTVHSKDYSLDYMAVGASVVSGIPANGGFAKVVLNGHNGTPVTLTGTSSKEKLITGITVIFEDSGGDEPAVGCLCADGNDADTYALIRACGFNYETPDLSGAHAEAPFRHIRQVYDSELNKYVFDFHLHIENDDDRGKENVTDRQRNEIKTDANSPESLVAKEGESLKMNWKFRLPEGMVTTSKFAHIHQIKGIDNSAGTADVGMPAITFTVRGASSAEQQFQIIHVGPTEDNTGNVYLAQVALADFIGEWVEVEETVKCAEEGSYSVIIKRISDGKVLVEVTGRQLNLWRSGTTGMRPKWGLYRYFGEDGSLKPQMRDEILKFADFKIEKLV